MRGVGPLHTAETNLPPGLDCPLHAVSEVTRTTSGRSRRVNALGWRTSTARVGARSNLAGARDGILFHTDVGPARHWLLARSRMISRLALSGHDESSNPASPTRPSLGDRADPSGGLARVDEPKRRVLSAPASALVAVLRHLDRDRRRRERGDHPTVLRADDELDRVAVEADLRDELFDERAPRLERGLRPRGSELMQRDRVLDADVACPRPRLEDAAATRTMLSAAPRKSMPGTCSAVTRASTSR
jgi:hypothetical protein